MKAKTFFFARTIICVMFLCALAGAAFAAEELPRAQLDEAERYFTEAYRRFLTRDHWGSLDYLDRALRANTYLVDQYLMKGLVMNRTGDYGASREALEYYLEVRPMDLMAPRILSYAIAQQRSLQRIVSPAALSVRWRVSKTDLQNELDLGFLRPINAKGLGKAGMWGKNLYLADTFGDGVFYRSKSERRVNVLPVSRPAAVLPTGDDSFYIVTEGGEVYYFGAFEQQSLTPSLRGALENTLIADAAFISENEFAVADPVTREVAFYSLATLTGAPVSGDPASGVPASGEPITGLPVSGDVVPAGPTRKTSAWSPPDDGEPFFEPRAIAAYGQWLAVADRGADRVYFLNLANGRDFFWTDVSRPRDVAWSGLGELFVISEDGDLLRLAVDFRDGRVEAADTLESGVTNGWTLFVSPDGDMYCIDVAGDQLWKAVPMPDDSVLMGSVSASAPKVTREENTESFLLDATFMSPFKTYSKMSSLIAHVVWNNRTIQSVARWNEPEAVTANAVTANAVLLNRPAPAGAVSASLENVVVENGSDIRIVLPSIWDSQGEALTNLVIDSTVDMTPEDLNAITLFCLNNGVELDIWARGVPPAELTRASGLTGGKTLFSVFNQPDLSPPHAKVSIRIPLPMDLSSSGYPGKSMLSLFFDVGLMQTRDWLPLWPDMIEE